MPPEENTLKSMVNKHKISILSKFIRNHKSQNTGHEKYVCNSRRNRINIAKKIT